MDAQEFQKAQKAKLLACYGETPESLIAKSQENDIEKAEDDDENKEGDDEDIEKAEGSKGGKIIGHTKSGKPIYEAASHSSHRAFSRTDHDDAISLHNKLMTTDKGNETTHYNQIDRHEALKKTKKED